MAKKSLILISLLLLCGVFAFLAAPGVVVASPPAQAYFQTPTPDSGGRVIYVVQEGQTCLQIELMTGAKVKDLIALNKLDEKCTLTVGQKLMLAIIEKPSETPGPSPTPTNAPLTPTPFNGNGQVCVLLFEDKNGNGVPDGDEAQIKDGAVSLSDRVGKISLTNNTPGGSDPLCFAEIPEGEYNISVAPPQGYNSTTVMNYPLKLAAGDKTTLDFGAQPGSAAVTSVPETPGQAGGGTSPLLGILGGILLLGGLVLGVYFWRMKR